ncbi:MAG TPA: hypothetical protein VLB84_14500, partial [Bacteroidia bacterium]|nr:hypothetical protein [Bacteroidia bacterium]
MQRVELRGALVDRVTQRWVIATGRRNDLVGEARWLDGRRAGHTSSDGGLVLSSGPGRFGDDGAYLVVRPDTADHGWARRVP